MTVKYEVLVTYECDICKSETTTSKGKTKQDALNNMKNKGWSVWTLVMCPRCLNDYAQHHMD